MPSLREFRTRSALAGLTAVAAVPLFLVAAPPASSAPDYDSRGYTDSTARCAAPDVMVVFGSTESSRVAICRDTDGDYEYRGVRVRDGARLIVPASQTSDGAFTATNDGIDYLVTSSALVVSAGEKVLRDEPMVDFHRASSSETPAESSAETPTESAPPSTSTPTSTTPLPPPLPAEVGGGEG
ncbi:hypothetical protein [Mycobacterium sp. 236(2023)]|uniref:hypothetical protein n=1 Tax=Mycobacterium sp. 236(2023) TaxID=3038163 RepID=UPI0024150E19|nr:hypothetical protein [Mycobacterium sp. 236(2023)]MDG4666715.1 hypothetical protein [Mycobacterium sp. 236(2023)]